MEYRQHWLVNSVGAKYDFTEKDHLVFLHEPKGFGFNRSYSSMRIGDSELLTSQQIVFGDITGDLLFYENGIGYKYREYQDFIQFCKYQPLEFHYRTPNETASYHCSVIFTQADKTEVSYSDHILHVPVTFHRMSEWLTDEDIVIVVANEDVGDGKSYDLTRDYSYSGSTLSNITLYNTGTDDVGFIVKVDGRISNPQFTLSQNGTVYGCCGILTKTDQLIINSIDTEEAIYIKYGGSVLSNPEQYQNFGLHSSYPNATLTWNKLKVGETKMNFTGANISGASGGIAKFSGTVTVSYKESFISV